MLLLKTEELKPLFGFAVAESLSFLCRFSDTFFPAQLLLEIIPESLRLHHRCFSGLCRLA